MAIESLEILERKAKTIDESDEIKLAIDDVQAKIGLLEGMK